MKAVILVADTGIKIANLRIDKRLIYVVLKGRRFHTNKRKIGVIMGDNVQTGINSMINVGTIIGNDVFIGLGTTATGELKPNTRVM